MALVNIRDIVYHAYNNRYAVGSFEIVSFDFLTAVISAAHTCGSPVILSVTDADQTPGDFEALTAAVERAALCAKVPIAIQFGRGTSLESIVRAIRLGCNGVAVDPSGQALAAAIKTTLEITELARHCGIAVEGKFGQGEDHHDIDSTHTRSGDTANCSSVQEAIAYAQRTNIDFLCVSVGTTRVESNGAPRLDIPRLTKINGSLAIPLVVHGDNALTDDHYHKLIGHGVAKINYSTALTDLAARYVVENRTATNSSSFRMWLQGLQYAVQEEITRCMHLWGSAGRAAQVLVQCRPWENVEHVIIFNDKNGNDEDTMQMFDRGQQQLSTIPGVRDVLVGKSVKQDSRFRYAWLIRFCNREVVEYYKEHPIHKHYADHYFRPRAGERITSDFQILNRSTSLSSDVSEATAAGSPEQDV